MEPQLLGNISRTWEVAPAGDDPVRRWVEMMIFTWRQVDDTLVETVITTRQQVRTHVVREEVVKSLIICQQSVTA